MNSAHQGRPGGSGGFGGGGGGGGGGTLGIGAESSPGFGGGQGDPGSKPQTAAVEEAGAVWPRWRRFQVTAGL